MTLTAVVTLAAMVVIRLSGESLTRMKALAVGMFWVALSVSGERAFDAVIRGRHALRFFLQVIVWDSDPSGGWVWPFVLSLQLCAPFALVLLISLWESTLRTRHSAELGPHAKS